MTCGIYNFFTNGSSNTLNTHILNKSIDHFEICYIKCSYIRVISTKDKLIIYMAWFWSCAFVWTFYGYVKLLSQLGLHLNDERLHIYSVTVNTFKECVYYLLVFYLALVH